MLENQLVAMCLQVLPSFFKGCAGRMLSCWRGRMQVWRFRLREVGGVGCLGLAVLLVVGCRVFAKDWHEAWLWVAKR